MKPFFTYYGGKYRSIGKYPKPEHDCVVEPFAGSAGYSVRHNAKRVVLCDLDPIICGIWSYLTKVSERELMSLPNLELGQSIDTLSVNQEAKWLIGFWVNKGSSQPKKTLSKWATKHPNFFWGDTVKARLASQVHQIRHWEVYQVSYRDCPVPGNATWFIDPPYQIAGKHYRFGSKGINYLDLGDWCRSRKGLTLVCENLGADWLPFQFLGDFKTSRRGIKSAEVIWTNQ